MVLSQAEVREILEPYHPLIRQVIEEAWQEWKTVRAFRADQGLPPTLYSRTISNYIFDAIARRGIMAFGAEPKVRVKIEAQTFKLNFRGLCARFKKGGEDKLGCNIPTQAALAFIEADAQLPGEMPDTMKVEIIWLPTELWTDLEQVLVIARDGDRLLWEYEIERPASGIVTALPTLPTTPDDAAPLVTPKVAAKISAKN